MKNEYKIKRQLISELSKSRKYQGHSLLEKLIQVRTSKFKLSNEDLQEQLSFASALNLIAETIISTDDAHNILQTMAEIVGSTLRVDRALIYDIDFDKHLLIAQCEWLNPNTADVLSTTGTYSLDIFMDACTYMLKDRYWLESHIDNYSPYASSDCSRDLLHKHMQIKSGFWYPFSFRDQGYYCLVFNQVNHRRIWRKEEIEFIASVAKLVEIAIQKINFLAEQKRHAEALRLSEERFYKIFHYSPISLMICSLNSGEFIDANECCLRMHGFTRDEFIGRTAVELNLWVDIDKRGEFYHELEETGFAHNLEIKSYKKSGEIFESLFSGVVIELNGEKCVSVSKTDITELRKYQSELSRLNSLNLIGEMAAGIAHEVRNPMTTVKGFLQLLGEKNEYKQHEEFFALMASELDRANSLITEFLSLAKNKPVDLKTQDLNSIIENLLPLIQADAMVTDKSVALEFNKIEHLLADDKEIRQLILNLVRNGLESMSPGGKLTIKTYMLNSAIVLVVQDQGNGIDSKAVDKIGTPFFTTKDNGTGLGLATCYSIVARHNASINFDTGPSGTTFYVNFKTH
ncbi:MAG TPA: ATP-binding protein [Desulfosporosinus sp.]